MWPFTKKEQPAYEPVAAPRKAEIAGLRSELAAAQRQRRSVVSAAEESIRQHRGLANDVLKAFERKER